MPKVNLTDSEISLLLTDLKVSIKELEDTLKERMDRNEDDYVLPFEMTEAVLQEYKNIYEKLMRNAPKEFLTVMSLIEMVMKDQEEQNGK